MSKGQSGVSLFKVQDTTAAGDAFVGYLSWALARGVLLPEAVRWANAAAALAVTRPGAQPSIPQRKEVERFLLKNMPQSVDASVQVKRLTKQREC